MFVVGKEQMTRININWKLRTIEDMKRDVKELTKKSLSRVLQMMSSISSV